MRRFFHRILLYRKSPLFLPVAGWAAYLLVFSLMAISMMGYPHASWYNAANLLCIILCPLILLCGAACIITGTVSSMRALIGGTAERRAAVFAAILAWFGIIFPIAVLLLALHAMYG